MAAKLTFEAKMQGMEQVLEMLKRAEQSMGDLGRVGSYSLEGVDKKMKEFQTSLETITKSQAGMGGIFKSFDELNKKSNEFLGKSYKGIVDAMKAEVKGFEQEVDKIKSKVTEAEKALEGFKTRKSSMSESEYQRGLSSRQRELSTVQSQAVAMRNQQHEMQQQVFMQQQMPGIGPAMNSLGMGQYGTVGAFMRGMPTMAMAPAFIGQTMEGIGNAGLQYGYTREADSYIAQARLRRQAANAAASGDITTYFLDEVGGGVEKKAMDSAWTKTKLMGTYLLDNPFIRALAGAGGGFAAGSAIPIIGNVAGAIGGGIAGFTSARNRSYSQIEAEQRGELRGRDSELYGILGKAAGENFMRESRDLDMGQRMYGTNSVHNMVMGLAANGQSMDRANPVLQMLMNQGMNPENFMGNADMAAYITGNLRFGVGENAQRQMVRATALNGGQLTDQQMGFLGIMSGAGLNSRGSMAARTQLGEYIAGAQADRGAGQDFASVGAPISAAVGQNAPGFNSTEGVQQGIMNFETQNRLMQGGSSALDMIMVSKMRQLGITNAVAIDAFIKMDIRNPRTQQAIARYTGKSVEEVQKALGEAAGTYKGMFESVLGKGEMDRFNKATGGDITTLLTTGVKAFDNTTAGGGKFMDTLNASLSGQGVGDSGKVETGFETLADKENMAKAQQQVTVDDQIKKALEGTGKTVTDAITQAVVKGFLDVADEVKKAGERITNDQKADGTPKSFSGTKADPRGR